MMIDIDSDSYPVGEQAFLQARAFALALVALRRARGKSNPADFEVGTPEWIAAVDDFAADIVRLRPE